MPYPALQVSFALGVASSDVPAGGDWVDITSSVLSLDIKHGDEDEFSQPGAGTCEIELDNSAGRFDPDNTSGPYYGDLLPLVWFRVRGGDSSVDTDVFYGQVSIDGWRLAASQFADSTVQVTVLDMLEQLANTELPSSVYRIEVEADNPALWWRLGESEGATATDSSGNDKHGEYLGGATFNSRASLLAYDADNAILLPGSEADGEPSYARRAGSVIVGSGDFTVEFWWEHSYDQAAEFQPRPIAYGGNDTLGYWKVWSLSGDNGLGFVTGDDAGLTLVSYTSALNNGVPRHVVCRRTAGTLSIAIDGSVVASASGSTHSISDQGVTSLGLADVLAPLGGIEDAVYDEFAIYTSSLDVARIEAHYEAGSAPWEGQPTSDRIGGLLDAVDFPAAQRNIGTGVTTLQPAELGTDALSALQEVAQAEGGTLYVDHHDGGKVRFRGRHDKWTDARSLTSQATFGDGAGEVTYTSVDIQDDKIVNYAAVQRANGATVVVRDAASETQYQRRTYSDTGLLFETDAESQARAEMIVAEKKDRHRRVRSVTLEPAKSTHPAWAQVFERQIGDRVTVRWRPPYGGTYSFDSWISGIAHSWRPSDSQRPWRTVLYLEPVPYGATGEPYFIIGTSTIGGPARIGY